MMGEIHEYSVGSRHELCGGAAHCPAQHSDCKGHVGSCLRGAVKQRANKGLIRCHEFVVEITIRFGAQRVFHKFRQVFGRRRARRVEGQRYSVREISRHQMGDVFFLFEDDGIVCNSDVDVQQ
eukprot:5881381-Pleurochrysis_carterae.AAC.2